MLSKRLVSAALSILLVLSLCTGASAATNPNEADLREGYAPVSLSLSFSGSSHKSFIEGYEDATFHPEDCVTRAEAAQMLYGLLENDEGSRINFADVPEDSWCYDAVGLLAAGGILEFGGDLIRPDEAISRGEFISMLSRLFPETESDCGFTDVTEDHPRYKDIAKAYTLGWINGYEDGSFRSGNSLSRAEAAAIINRALGRTADREKIDSIFFPVFSDLFPAHWAYYEVMEATVAHDLIRKNGEEVWTSLDEERIKHAEGFVSIGSELYYCGEDGEPVTDTDIGSFHFGPDGKYTCGDEMIDAYAKAALDKVITPSMTQEEKLHAAYLYTRDGFTYLKRNYYQIGDTGWELENARVMFETGLGNCYCYTSVFYYLSRQLGYDATAISGVVGTRRSPHGWVEIDFDGVTNIFDTELEMAYRKKGVYKYDFYMMSYDEVPWPYVK